MGNRRAAPEKLPSISVVARLRLTYNGRMTLPAIDELIIQWCGELLNALEQTSSYQPQTRELMRRTAVQGALPLYKNNDWFVAIQPDTTLVKVDDCGDTLRLTPLSRDNKWATLALAAGSLEYPQLRQLLPPRPATASNCPHCRGAGFIRISAGGSDLKMMCMHCSGVGWIEGKELW